MSITSLRMRVLALAVTACAGLNSGCGQSQVPLVEVPQTELPKSVDPKELPKSQRPGRGSSAGLTHPPNQ
jgi:hypothetical protein